MSEFHYMILGGVSVIGSAITLPLAAIILIAVYLRPPEISTNEIKYKNWAWSLWSIGVVCLVNSVAFLIHMGESDAVRDFDWWLFYSLTLGVIFVVLFLPAAIYWLRVLTAKGRS
jgi:hypothetical protein